MIDDQDLDMAGVVAAKMKEKKQKEEEEESKVFRIKKNSCKI